MRFVEEFKTEGEVNREIIYEYILKHGPMSIHEIYTAYHNDERKLSKRQIHDNINKLLKQGLIVKVEGRRYMTADEDIRYITTFGEIVKDAFSFLIDYPLFDSSNKFGIMFRHEDTFGGYVDEKDFERFRKKVNDFSISNDLLQQLTNTVKDLAVSKDLLQQLATDKIKTEGKNEIFLMDFANRIGSYIIYLFIQTIAPMKLNTLPEQVTVARRDGLSRKLLQRSLDIEMMFKFFHAFLFYSGQIKKPFPKKHTEYTFFELEQEEYDSVSKTFKNAYPNIFTAFEQYYRNFSDHQLTDKINKEKQKEKGKDCKHDWKKTNIFKLKEERYHCYKCDSFITKQTFDKMIKENEKES